MTASEPKLFLCNCEKSMPVDGGAIARALGLPEPEIHTQLCRNQIGKFEGELDGDRRLCVACTQESALFAEIAAEAGAQTPVFFNIRELAGWSAEAADAAPKMAALAAVALQERAPVRTKTIESDGLCLVVGSGQAAFDAARLLNRTLSVTLLLAEADDLVLPPALEFPIYSGRVAAASGGLGNFAVTVDGYAPMLPSSRAEPQFALARDGARSECSVIFDISGGTPLFARHGSRDGYFRADPGDPAAVMRAIFEAGDYAGTFEKPIYVGYDAEICAHSRSRKTGCSKCIDNCPTGAIAPDGDNVRIDIDICGGCGNCAAHCPTGAAIYHYPSRQDLTVSIHAALRAYFAGDGERPVLLFHDSEHGLALINAMARFGRGLPAHVIPLELHSVSSIGHDALLAALGAGAASLAILADPRREPEFEAIRHEIELVGALTQGLGFGSNRIALAFESDPEKAESRLYALQPHESAARQEFTPMADKREAARMALTILAEAAENQPETIALPAHAAYGAVTIDTDGCTLCLACVSACPADALRDNPDKPQVRFVEAACVQCGLCAATCPEQVIRLEPRYNFAPSAMQPVTLHEEEPFACIRCGKPFAARSTIERISERLAGEHWMYSTDERVELIRMCDTCRLEALAEKSGDPFAIAQRRVPRTTDDYLEAEKKGLSLDDFIDKE